MAYTPPPYNPAAPAQPKGSKLWLWVLIAVLLFCVVMSVGLFMGGRALWGQVSNTMQCMITFETAHASVIAYTKENNGRLPDAKNWMTATEPYYRRLSERFANPDMPGFMRPTPPGQPLKCEGGDRDTGIAFNAALSGKLLSDIPDQMKTVLLFEADAPSMNLAQNYVPRPKESGPKMFGQQRDWIRYYVDRAANSDPFQTDGGSNTQIRIDPNDALPPSDSPETKTAAPPTNP